MTTSSEKFEYDFALNLSRLLPVVVFSGVMDYGHAADNGRFCIEGFGGANAAIRWRNLSRLFRGRGRDTVVVFFGYDLLLVLTLLFVKFNFDCVVVDFIFDSHVGAMGHYSSLKASLAGVYFRVSIALLNLLDGFLLFRRAAAIELGLKRPYLVTRPGIDVPSNVYAPRLEQNPFVITYAGSLMKYNGISELLAAFASSSDPELRLRLFGSGDLQLVVEAYCQNDPRVHYGGLVDQARVRSELCNSNLLVNLRDPSDYVSRFAFPSKLVECMATGVAVLSTDLGFDDDLKGCLYLVDPLDPGEVLKSIEAAKSAGADWNVALGLRARSYLLSRNQWPGICSEVVGFLHGLVACR